MGGLSKEIFLKVPRETTKTNSHGFNLTLKGCNITQSWCRSLIALD